MSLIAKYLVVIVNVCEEAYHSMRLFTDFSLDLPTPFSVLYTLVVQRVKRAFLAAEGWVQSVIIPNAGFLLNENQCIY
jgi:hypothetical protein